MTPPLVFPDGVTPESFLHFFWQKRALLMPGALPGFASPLSPDDLAGLSLEDDVESRIVEETRRRKPWTVRHGPFDEKVYAKLPPTHWTLLVQDVDKLVPEVATLLDRFRFLPDWRVDDIMVSYAADQGSVGPHWDEYDVFLIQAMGRRRWQIAHERPAPDNVLPGLDLRILRDFTPDATWVLEPGDILYLPPGVPHWGVAQGPCMTYSVGFRAPSLREMLSSWFEDALATVPEEHFRDGEMPLQAHSAEITPAAMQRACEAIMRLASRPAEEYQRWFGRFVTETKPNLTVEPRATAVSAAELRQVFEAHGVLHRHPFARMAFYPREDGTDWLFVNATDRAIAGGHRSFLNLLCQWRDLHFGYLVEWLEEPACLALLTDLYNAGYYEAGDEG
jgi:50S ribosomal protein L16 3-hydroxylase